MAAAESAPQDNLFALFVQQCTNISADTERHVGLSAIAKLLVIIRVNILLCT